MIRVESSRVMRRGGAPGRFSRDREASVSGNFPLKRIKVHDSGTIPLKKIPRTVK